MTEHGHVHWNELNTRHVKRAKEFYRKTLGWTFEDMPMGPGMTYTIINSGDEMVGGIFKLEGPTFKGVPEHWLTYFAVDDLDKRVKKLKAAGGKVIRKPWHAPTVGRIAIVADSNGAVQGWMVPAPDGM